MSNSTHSTDDTGQASNITERVLQTYARSANNVSVHNAPLKPYEPFTPWEKLAILSVAAGVVAVTLVVVVCLVFPVCPGHEKCFGESDSEAVKRRRRRRKEEEAFTAALYQASMLDAKRSASLDSAGSAATTIPLSNGLRTAATEQHRPLGVTPTQSIVYYGSLSRQEAQQASTSSPSLDPSAPVHPQLQQQQREQHQGHQNKAQSLLPRPEIQRIQELQELEKRRGSLQERQDTAAAALHQSSQASSRKDSLFSSLSSTSAMSIGSALSALSMKPSSDSQGHSNSPQANGHTSAAATGSGGFFSRSFSRDSKHSTLASVTFSLHLEPLAGKGSGSSSSQRPKTTNDPSPVEDEANPSNTNAAKLSIKVLYANDLPLRDYGQPVDPAIRVSLHRDRRSLRRKPKMTLAEFQTDLVKHETNPKYDRTFSTDVSLNDYKGIRLKVSALDCDRHTKTSEIGSLSLPLKDVKALASSEEPVQLTNYLALKKQEYGELNFGMTYLPTAQRLSFTIAKAANLKYDELVAEIDNFTPYVRILQLNSTGRVVKKKKTNPRHGTKEPAWNETLNFELSPAQLDSTVFLLLVAHRQSSLELQELESSSSSTTSIEPPLAVPPPPSAGGSGELAVPSAMLRGCVSPIPRSSVGKDLCLGRIAVGSRVRGERERAHWANVLASPRKVITQWQTLY